MCRVQVTDVGSILSSAAVDSVLNDDDDDDNDDDENNMEINASSFFSESFSSPYTRSPTVRQAGTRHAGVCKTRICAAVCSVLHTSSTRATCREQRWRRSACAVAICTSRRATIGNLALRVRENASGNELASGRSKRATCRRLCIHSFLRH